MIQDIIRQSDALIRECLDQYKAQFVLEVNKYKNQIKQEFDSTNGTINSFIGDTKGKLDELISSKEKEFDKLIDETIKTIETTVQDKFNDSITKLRFELITESEKVVQEIEQKFQTYIERNSRKILVVLIKSIFKKF